MLEAVKVAVCARARVLARVLVLLALLEKRGQCLWGSVATSTQTSDAVLPGLELRARLTNTSKTETGSASIAASRPISTVRYVATAGTASHAFGAASDTANSLFNVFCCRLESSLYKGSKDKSQNC